MTHRRSGVLLHPTALPGRLGTGTLGGDARAFVDWLQRANQSLWQMLPITPVDGYGCPYSSPSAFAGNPLLLSLDDLVTDGLLAPDDSTIADLAMVHDSNPGRVDFDAQHRLRIAAVRRAARNVLGRGDAGYRGFAAEHAGWLDPWADWAAARGGKATSPDVERAVQYLFDVQWSRLRTYARERGVALVGDLPIFVRGDSADVASSPHLFRLDDDGRPLAVAGVPPAPFSPDGQLWGNPLYDWAAHAAEGWAWWKERVRSLLRRVDLVRVDHFRGFAACWEVPADAATAAEGRWVPGSGRALFDALADEFGELPFIAEDLGVITDDVVELRDGLGLPGMRILQFGFDGNPDPPYLPHNYVPGCVVYSGTHDNDTTAGWYASSDDKTKDVFRRYVARDGSDPAGDLLRLALASVAETAIVPLQDVLRLGGDARFNAPGTVGERNWTWRLLNGQLTDGHADELGAMTRMFGRACADRA